MGLLVLTIIVNIAHLEQISCPSRYASQYTDIIYCYIVILLKNVIASALHGFLLSAM